MVNVNTLPTQLFKKVATWYTAVCVELALLTRLPLIFVDWVDCVCPPDRDAEVTVGAFQVYLVPLGARPSNPFCGDTLNPTPPQTVLLIALTFG